MGKIVDKLKEASEQIVEETGKHLVNFAEKGQGEIEKVPNEEPEVPQEYEIPEARKYELGGNIKERMEEIFSHESSFIDEQIFRIENIAFKYHLNNVKEDYEPLFPIEKDSEKAEFVIKTNSCEKQMGGFFITKFVFTKEELQSDKLNNVYSCMCELGSTLALCFHRTKTECTVSFLTKADGVGHDTKTRSENNLAALKNVLSGNFPGINIKNIPSGEYNSNIMYLLPELYHEVPEEVLDMRGTMKAYLEQNDGQGYDVATYFDEIFNPKQCKAISIVTGIPGLKSKDSKYLNQGIEKILDGIVPSTEDENYTLMLLAEPLTQLEVSDMRNGYEQLASMLTPYKGFQYTESISESQHTDEHYAKNLTKQISKATSASLGLGASAGASANASANINKAKGSMQSENIGHSETDPGKTKNYSVKDGGWWTRVKKGCKNFGKGGEKLSSVSESEPTVSNSFGHTFGENQNSGCGAGAQAGASIGVNFNAGMNSTITSGHSYTNGVTYGKAKVQSLTEGVTKEYQSIAVSNVIERLEKEITRIKQSESSGLWKFAGYVISGQQHMAKRVAYSYQGLIQGEESAVERNSVNTWDVGNSEFNAILLSLLNMEHPCFRRKASVVTSKPDLISCTTDLNSAELALALNFPQKAIAGVPVVSCASFGRNICTVSGNMKDQNDVVLGKLYHMLKEEKHADVCLGKEKLTSHVFVTGSTGAGKSNVIYTLLDKLCTLKDTATEETDAILNDSEESLEYTTAEESRIKFMVIEPTKGEYRDIFGGYSNVKVYGTNPKIDTVLRINPFYFPENIHVLEHIDRLIEIFNACWPMYAAMPAVLKEAVEQCYKDKGWNLITSTCSPKRFPTFRNLLKVLPEIIAKSSYSSDTKSDYVGALVTRVNSLTTGINGTIFNAVHGISSEELFDENVIIDLSRVGSNETKSLLMGMIVLRLQEYRMHERMNGSNKVNSELKHITVLEEAHLLLRKTPFNQSQEGANLQGKSVEMLTNAIAEMRTYGESFLIADQAPELLDPAVIRNTNTKIVLRLPDANDRSLVGNAMALDKEQIDELAKLPNWVAAVYQSDWLEAVLCLVDCFPKEREKKYKYDSTIDKKAIHIVLERLLDNKLYDELNDNSISEIKHAIKKIIRLDDDMENIIDNCLRGKIVEEDTKENIIMELFDWKDISINFLSIFESNDYENLLNKFFECVQAEYDLETVDLTKKAVYYFANYSLASISVDNLHGRESVEKMRAWLITAGGKYA